MPCVVPLSPACSLLGFLYLARAVVTRTLGGRKAKKYRKNEERGRSGKKRAFSTHSAPGTGSFLEFLKASPVPPSPLPPAKRGPSGSYANAARRVYVRAWVTLSFTRLRSSSTYASFLPFRKGEGARRGNEEKRVEDIQESPLSHDPLIFLLLLLLLLLPLLFLLVSSRKPTDGVVKDH